MLHSRRARTLLGQSKAHAARGSPRRPAPSARRALSASSPALRKRGKPFHDAARMLRKRSRGVVPPRTLDILPRTVPARGRRVLLQTRENKPLLRGTPLAATRIAPAESPWHRSIPTDRVRPPVPP